MKFNDIPLYASPELGRKVVDYSEQHSTPIPSHISDFHQSIVDSRDDSEYMSSNFQSQFHHILAKIANAKRVLEIGVYVGYSAMVWANAVGPDGLVTGLEYSGEYAKIAEESFAARGIKNVEIVVGPAADTLPKLNPSEPYDIVFIDADKTGYPGYLRQLLQGSQPGSSKRLLRPGALIVSDNVLRRGLAADINALGKDVDESTLKMAYAVKEFNELTLANPRLETFLMPLWDGLSIARLVD
ncbi:S-adenosyl-L-methionine-dependent methyltransferase [Mariannaea sp. PMI_226]|nr:S-adenosyl-L-methionine-dependent methyltransferase [Mariannaea sp. PMI_226]